MLGSYRNYITLIKSNRGFVGTHYELGFDSVVGGYHIEILEATKLGQRSIIEWHLRDRHKFHYEAQILVHIMREKNTLSTLISNQALRSFVLQKLPVYRGALDRR